MWTLPLPPPKTLVHTRPTVTTTYTLHTMIMKNFCKVCHFTTQFSKSHLGFKFSPVPPIDASMCFISHLAPGIHYVGENGSHIQRYYSSPITPSHKATSSPYPSINHMGDPRNDTCRSLYTFSNAIPHLKPNGLLSSVIKRRLTPCSPTRTFLLPRETTPLRNQKDIS